MKKLVLALVLGLTLTHLEAQKIKYKDLYPLLNVQKYEDAEPFLKQFLQDEKNIDHPNANFQMALIFNDKALKDDVLTETELFQQHADSALIYYQLALKYIDDKEVRKNDEYYQAYKRRDVRTGKFGINLGDVQFDIEEKIKALKERKEKVAMLSGFFTKSRSAYDSANMLFQMVKKKYPTEKRLLLRLTNVDVEVLDEINAHYNDAVENFESYKNTLSSVNKTGYNQELNVKKIVNYNEEGMATANMLKNNIEFWDYASWTSEVKKAYKEEILPLFEQLITFDQELKRLGRTVSNDSVSVLNKIPSVRGIAALAQLREFDENPMPAIIFNYKAKTLAYNSYALVHRDYADTTDVLYRTEVLGDQLSMLNVRDSLIQNLAETDFVEESRNYAPYVESEYGSAEQLEQYVKNELNAVVKLKGEKEDALKQELEKTRWLVGENDSIPLFKESSTTKYIPLVVDSMLTAGLYAVEEAPAKGYLARVTRTRLQDVNFKFDLDTENLNPDNIASIKAKAMALAAKTGNIYFIMFYAPLPEQESYAATVAKANDEGLIWTNNITLATSPGQLAYNIQTDEVIINYDIEGVGGAEVVGGKLVLSKDGKIVKH